MSLGPFNNGKPEYVRLLEKIDLFQGLERATLEDIAANMIERQYGRNEIIVRQGEMGLGLHLILQGKVKLEDETSGETTLLAELGPEQSFTEMSVVDSQPRPETITTLEPTDCLLLTRDHFAALARKYPEIPIQVARALAERLKRPSSPSAPPAATTDPAPSNLREVPKDSLALSDTIRSYKESAQGAMLDLFRNFYAMKAMTRFSVAVLGCPVEGRSPDVAHQIRVDHVKVLLLPADRKVEIQIEASEPGTFTLHVLTPNDYPEARFGPVQTSPGTNYRVTVTPQGVELALATGRRSSKPSPL